MSAVTLRALGWDHPRCMSAMRACARAWEAQGRERIDWHARSLTSFGDEPLENLAGSYDILVIDHPFCGTAARAQILRPLDDLLPLEVLQTLAAGAIGPSQRSYGYEGSTWALASDAACQVSAYRPDLLEVPMPTTWPQALELTRTLGTRTGLPLSPAHAISSLLTLWAGAGLDPLGGDGLVDENRGLEGLEWLSEMHRDGHRSSTHWEPPDALAALTTGEIVYVPLTYGYVNYSSLPPAAGGCRFIDIPGIRGAVLGGAGLAVSAASRHPGAAADFAAWACGEWAQREIVAENDGQPAHVGCWEDAQLDTACGGFYSSTRATIEAAWVRPREPWWPELQLALGEAVTAGLEQRTPPRQLLDRLLHIHDQITTGSTHAT